MKTTLLIIVILGFFVYLGEPTISFKPFKIAFEKPYTPFAVFFLILAITLFKMQETKTSYKKGVIDTIENINEILLEKGYDIKVLRKD